MDLIQWCLNTNPVHRPSLADMLTHPFFSLETTLNPDPCPEVSTTNSGEASRSMSVVDTSPVEMENSEALDDNQNDSESPATSNSTEHRSSDSEQAVAGTFVVEHSATNQPAVGYLEPGMDEGDVLDEIFGLQELLIEMRTRQANELRVLNPDEIRGLDSDEIGEPELNRISGPELDEINGPEQVIPDTSEDCFVVELPEIKYAPGSVDRASVEIMVESHIEYLDVETEEQQNPEVVPPSECVVLQPDVVVEPVDYSKVNWDWDYILIADSPAPCPEPAAADLDTTDDECILIADSPAALVPETDLDSNDEVRQVLAYLNSKEVKHVDMLIENQGDSLDAKQEYFTASNESIGYSSNPNILDGYELCSLLHNVRSSLGELRLMTNLQDRSPTVPANSPTFTLPASKSRTPKCCQSTRRQLDNPRYRVGAVGSASGLPDVQSKRALYSGSLPHSLDRLSNAGRYPRQSFKRSSCP